jgi:hypothetical protein
MEVTEEDTMIIVGVDGSVTSPAAVEWAANDAFRMKESVRTAGGGRLWGEGTFGPDPYRTRRDALGVSP